IRHLRSARPTTLPLKHATSRTTRCAPAPIALSFDHSLVGQSISPAFPSLSALASPCESSVCAPDLRHPFRSLQSPPLGLIARLLSAVPSSGAIGQVAPESLLAVVRPSFVRPRLTTRSALKDRPPPETS